MRLSQLLLREEEDKEELIYNIKVFNTRDEYDNNRFEYVHAGYRCYALYFGELPFDFSHLEMPLSSKIKGYEGTFSTQHCSHLKSLKGAPKAVNYLQLNSCDQLTTLEHAPMIVTHNVWCEYMWHLETLKGIGKEYLKEIGGNFFVPTKVKSHALGLMRIKRLSKLVWTQGDVEDDLNKAYNIILAYLETNKDIMECQEELIQNDLKEFARI